MIHLSLSTNLVSEVIYFYHKNSILTTVHLRKRENTRERVGYAPPVHIGGCCWGWLGPTGHWLCCGFHMLFVSPMSSSTPHVPPMLLAGVWLPHGVVFSTRGGGWPPLRKFASQRSVPLTLYKQFKLFNNSFVNSDIRNSSGKHKNQQRFINLIQ